MKVVQTSLKQSSSFLSLQINDLNVGEHTVFDIYIKKDENYLIIIEAGTLLTDKLYEKLKKQDKLYISDKDKSKQYLSCKSLKYYIKHNKNNLKKSLNLLYEINNKLFQEFLDSKENQIDVECVRSIVKSIIFLIKVNPDYLKKTIPHFVNENVLEMGTQALHVCIYSLTIGTALKFDDEKLSLLGIASLLHDIGNKKIDKTIISKDSKLSSMELDTLHKHSKYSVEIIKHNGINNPYIIDAVTHHHENIDGSGYPDHLDEKYISDFSSIISISDVFDALTNSRPYRKAYSSFDAIKMMMKDESMAGRFNNEYLRVFLRLI